MNDNPASEPVLRFDKPLVIVGGGAVDFGTLQSLHAGGAHIVAADGGGDVCAIAGIVPEAIIGDIDSLEDPAGWADKTQVIKLTEQLTTDFEKCLYSTEAPITIAVGMTGKRFDHTLAALSAVIRFAPQRQIALLDEMDIALGMTKSICFKTHKGERVSIQPLQEVKFSRSIGLQYPLNGLTLAPGKRTGVSNVATENEVIIEPADSPSGVWLLILGRDRLEDMLSQLQG